MEMDWLRIGLTCVAGGILSGLLGVVLLPVLRALKAPELILILGSCFRIWSRTIFLRFNCAIFTSI